MNINKIFLNVIEEQNILKTTKTKPIVDAIKSRNMITFYYSGPQKPKKDSVKNGYRVRAEAVALGLSKKGNLIVRAWVQPPSVSKKGFAKHGWRTFIVGRMSNVEVTDDIFNGKRPEYKEGSDNSMTVTYVTTDWTNKPEIKKTTAKPIEKAKVEPVKPETSPVVVPKTEPTKTELPQPKPEEKPSEDPQDADQESLDKKKDLYNTKKSEWVNKQKEIGGNIKPGQGTRARFSKEVEKELSQPKPEEKPSVSPEDEVKDKNLQESLKRIKRLMFS